MMTEAVFWTCFICVFYVYGGYPAVLMIWRALARRPVHKHAMTPTVSLVIAVHNERDNIHRKMCNCFELDYPPEMLQVILSLDGSTDGTEDVARYYEGLGVTVVRLPMHFGKAEALNRGVAAAVGEIVVFTDARQKFERGAIRELIANFADPLVGAVSGELVLLDADGSEASDGVGIYWRYEKRLRAMESELHSVTGATGAIYAIRRDLFRPLPAGTVLDDVAIPMGVVLQGKRCIQEPAARAYDLVSSSLQQEYGRKVRTLMGNYQLVARMPELLVPWRNPIFTQFVSHKLGRLAAPHCLAGLFVSNLFLLRGIYLWLFAAQILWYLLAFVGWRIASGDGKPHPNREIRSLLGPGVETR